MHECADACAGGGGADSECGVDGSAGLDGSAGTVQRSTNDDQQSATDAVCCSGAGQGTDDGKRLAAMQQKCAEPVGSVAVAGWA